MYSDGCGIQATISCDGAIPIVYLALSVSVFQKATHACQNDVHSVIGELTVHSSSELSLVVVGIVPENSGHPIL